jgi:hypothetical protein
MIATVTMNFLTATASAAIDQATEERDIGYVEQIVKEANSKGTQHSTKDGIDLLANAIVKIELHDYYSFELEPATRAALARIDSYASTRAVTGDELIVEGLRALLQSIGHGTWLGPPDRVGNRGPITHRSDGHFAIVTIPSVRNGSCEGAREALEQENRAKPTGLVLDLRGNKGGPLKEIVCLHALFAGPGERPFKVRGRDGKDSEPVREIPRLPSTAQKLSMAVLLDDQTDMGGAMLAIALHDSIGAPLVGQPARTIDGDVLTVMPLNAPLHDGVLEGRDFYLVLPTEELIRSNGQPLASGFALDRTIPAAPDSAAAQIAEGLIGSPR